MGVEEEVEGDVIDFGGDDFFDDKIVVTSTQDRIPESNENVDFNLSPIANAPRRLTSQQQQQPPPAKLPRMEEPSSKDDDDESSVKSLISGAKTSRRKFPG